MANILRDIACEKQCFFCKIMQQLGLSLATIERHSIYNRGLLCAMNKHKTLEASKALTNNCRHNDGTVRVCFSRITWQCLITRKTGNNAHELKLLYYLNSQSQSHTSYSIRFKPYLAIYTWW